MNAPGKQVENAFILKKGRIVFKTIRTLSEHQLFRGHDWEVKLMLKTLDEKLYENLYETLYEKLYETLCETL